MGKRTTVLKVDEGLFLHPYSLKDAPVIFNLIDRNREHLGQYGGKTAKRFPTLESLNESILNPPPKAHCFSIWADNVLVGSIKIRSVGNRTAKLSYWLGKQYEGNGYAIRSARRIIQSVFQAGKILSIIAYVDPLNEKSIRVLDRLAFVLSKKTEQGHTYNLERWLPFYLDTYRVSEWITSKRRWIEVVTQKFGGRIETLKEMRFRSPSIRDGLPDFGQGPCHRFNPTLGQWAERYGISLKIT